MAQEDDNLSIGNFSIQDTMEMGTGNQKLLNDLFAPETASAEPGEVTPIINEVTNPEPAPAPDKPKGKEIAQPNDDGTPKKASDIISNFLGAEDEEEDDIPVDTKKVITNDAPEDTPQDNGGTQFRALANDLFNLGVFNKEEDEENVEINTPEEFLERFQAEKKKELLRW